jgi:hypothetical protein
MFKTMTNLVTSATSAVTSTVSSVANKIHNPDAAETYEFYYEHNSNFNNTVENYVKKFNKENLEKNNILSCVIVKKERIGSVEKVQRHIVFDLLNLPLIKIPETILSYFPDTKITIEHNIELNRREKYMKIEIKNITQPQLKLYESSSFISNDDDVTIYKVKASLSVNIFFGVNETVRKMWYFQYKTYYNNYDKKIEK